MFFLKNVRLLVIKTFFYVKDKNLSEKQITSVRVFLKKNVLLSCLSVGNEQDIFTKTYDIAKSEKQGKINSPLVFFFLSKYKCIL